MKTATKPAKAKRIKAHACTSACTHAGDRLVPNPTARPQHLWTSDLARIELALGLCPRGQWVEIECGSAACANSLKTSLKSRLGIETRRMLNVLAIPHAGRMPGRKR